MTNQELYPTNDTLAKKLSELETKINSISLSRQPYIADWIEVNELPTYVASDILSFATGSTIYNILAVGDHIRLKQGGAFKYFYVIEVGAVNITLLKSTSYSLTATTITDLSYSKLSNPVGFPSYLTWTPTVWSTDGGGTLIDITASLADNFTRMTMQGSLLFLEVEVALTATIGVNKRGIVTSSSITRSVEQFVTTGYADMGSSGTKNVSMAWNYYYPSNITGIYVQAGGSSNLPNDVFGFYSTIVCPLKLT